MGQQTVQPRRPIGRLRQQIQADKEAYRAEWRAHLNDRVNPCLFLEALQAYTEFVLHRMNAVSANTAREKVEALLRAFLPGELALKRPAGCLIARSCAEAAELSPAGRAAALASATRQREILERILQEGAKAGELARDAEIDALAWYYFGVLQAVTNFPQVGASRDDLARMIDIAMAAWPTIGTSAAI